ncbi:unnamed protein product [Urochloa humidicola]
MQRALWTPTRGSEAMAAWLIGGGGRRSSGSSTSPARGRAPPPPSPARAPPSSPASGSTLAGRTPPPLRRHACLLAPDLCGGPPPAGALLLPPLLCSALLSPSGCWGRRVGARVPAARAQLGLRRSGGRRSSRRSGGGGIEVEELQCLVFSDVEERRPAELAEERRRRLYSFRGDLLSAREVVGKAWAHADVAFYRALSTRARLGVRAAARDGTVPGTVPRCSSPHGKPAR